jgi:hypothetical protein
LASLFYNGTPDAPVVAVAPVTPVIFVPFE